MKKILIANRGEIARRIIRTCERLGIETVAIHSEADGDLPYVSEATQAVLIGPNPVVQSYLQIDKIIEEAKKHGVDAIHPGYGLLSENAGFARRVAEAGMVFIGPSSDIIEKMGDKIKSRRTMIKASVPVVPGTEEGVTTLEEALQEAEAIGYPLMLKASAGGGGIGMVRCESEQALTQQFVSVKNRAKAYFGDDVVYLEKFIADARHIEVQIFGDHHGNLVHLYERNCSVQRRNQKVIEESPSPNLPQDVRERLCEAALQAGKAVNYTNAGTVEFIVDPDNNFYFLEMNTRLQVEHPVTEEVTGLDLVEWQLTVADGGELPSQDSIQTKGHAIEYRVYAEDPKTFFPSPGKLEKLQWGEGARIETGYEEGNQVTPFYDPMISKIIIRGTDRIDALSKSQTFFNHVTITGVKTNIPLFKEFIRSEEFISGDYATAVLPQWMEKIKEEHTL
ncbi:biotin carboxylase N-terminal domain-containing protein [Microbacterium sp. APC 3898]|uniref:biotin carboxylase n=1 Tax=Planococcus notacanthi TaxID=3035188 RepID=A0ABT7ZG61_9BACL|nr:MULTISPECIES: biotin carboxylase N-terminal domain-containing protein [Terrabacteria group]MDN3426062.1 biotin carboxylase N-terminal domain-containing protein [Planococcus sp. APC 4016]MDN3497759.1 biotin carboxylase N-terminal domain-containing protein [Microbacterium sp. APC 3898]